jgi:hypothetical protein
MMTETPRKPARRIAGNDTPAPKPVEPTRASEILATLRKRRDAAEKSYGDAKARLVEGLMSGGSAKLAFEMHARDAIAHEARLAAYRDAVMILEMAEAGSMFVDRLRTLGRELDRAERRTLRAVINPPSGPLRGGLDAIEAEGAADVRDEIRGEIAPFVKPGGEARLIDDVCG